MITVSEKDLYCIAKILQSSIYGENQFDGCQFCKYQCHIKFENQIMDLAPNYEKVIFRLQDITGVDFSVCKKPVSKRLKNDKNCCGDGVF